MIVETMGNNGQAGQAVKDILRQEGGAAFGTVIGAASDRLADAIRGGAKTTVYDDESIYGGGGSIRLINNGGIGGLSPVALGALGLGAVALIVLAVK